MSRARLAGTARGLYRISAPHRFPGRQPGLLSPAPSATLGTKRSPPAIPDPVDLGEELEAYVARLVETGRFASRQDVLRDGIRLVQQREAAIGELRLRYLQGLALAERGNVQEAERVLSELRAEIAALKPQTKAGN
ncbi:MAG: type II toxin-antitoxin system ParD family antitoxin [Alphaproteobacteria bacterium]|nr:type II toxin-antitoxin system ParD family antitoxin [Alphaproteobacteria bacterium]